MTTTATAYNPQQHFPVHIPAQGNVISLVGRPSGSFAGDVQFGGTHKGPDLFTEQTFKHSDGVAEQEPEPDHQGEGQNFQPVCQVGKLICFGQQDHRGRSK